MDLEQLKEITIRELEKIREIITDRRIKQLINRMIEEIKRLSPKEALEKMLRMLPEMATGTVSRMSDSGLGIYLVESLIGLYPDRITYTKSSVKSFGYTDGYVVYLNPYIVDTDEPLSAVFLAFHELLHMLFAHVQRSRGKKPFTWNVATDIFINHMLFEENLNIGLVPHIVVTLDKVNRLIKEVCKAPETSLIKEPDLIHLTDEDIYSWLYSVITRYCREDPDSFLSRELSREGLGLPINRDIEDVEPNKLAPPCYKRLRETIRDMGRFSSKEIRDLLIRMGEEAVLNWRELLREAFNATGRIPMETWLRPSRRLPGEWPGTKWVGEPEVVILIDFSGSISPEIAGSFLAEINRLSKEYTSNVIIIGWDARVMGIYRLRDMTLEVEGRTMYGVDLHKAVEILGGYGGGGTVIKPALEKAKEMVYPWTSVVVMTDGLIFDADNPETIDLANYIASTATTAVYIYTIKRLDKTFGDQWIKVHYTP